MTGEQVVYAYDALNRLASAAATNNSWGQSYGYDGFGNLTDQTVTAGTAPSLHTVYSASNNRQGDCADANGNINSAPTCWYNPYTYDVENRIVSVPGQQYQQYTRYAYGPGNKRVWRGTTTQNQSGISSLTVDEITFWSVTGQKLATYAVTGDPSVVYFWDNYDNAPTPTVTVALATSNYYFGGKLIKNANGYIGSDRLGSMGKYYPWGQEKPSATTNGTEKFTGYFRDAETGLDYALNRYHQPGMGRFLTPDPYRASGGPKDPASWNRYAYAGSDPVNHRDPTGQDWCWADDFDPDGLNPCGVPLICAPNFVPTEYGCSLNIQIPPIDLSGLANIDPYVLDADILTAEGVFDSSTVATNGDPQNDSFQVSLSPDALLVLYQNGLLQASPQTIDLAEKGFEEVLTLGTAAIAAITVWIQSNKAKFFAQEAETERDRLFRCAQQFLEDLKRCTSIPNPETRKQCIAFAIARKRNCLGQVNPPSSK